MKRFFTERYKILWKSSFTAAVIAYLLKPLISKGGFSSFEEGSINAGMIALIMLFCLYILIRTADWRKKMDEEDKKEKERRKREKEQRLKEKEA
ncbi:MAG: hypothetical protein LBP56_07150 [Odoribacteraceae bacterium]|jgi:type VI protein secretion system component VasK|nr:hypothetical protein [Odoribacteraceae bacterium]